MPRNFLNKSGANLSTDCTNYFATAPNGFFLYIHIVPNASKNEIVGVYNGRLKVKIRKPAVDGKANKEMIQFLANVFDCPKSALSLVRGELSRKKTVLISCNLEKQQRITKKF